MATAVRMALELPVVACWKRLKVPSIQLVTIDPEGIEQPCVILKEVTRDEYNAQFTGPVRAAGRFFYQVRTD